MNLQHTLALLSIGTVALLGTAGVVGKRRVEQNWADLNVRIDAAQADVESLKTERPVLHGEPNADEAFEHYVRAIALIPDDERAGGDSNPTYRQILGWSDEERASYAAYARDFAPVLDELRLGAQARRSKLAYDWEARGAGWDRDGGVDTSVVHWRGARRLSTIAFTAFVLELLEGRSESALDILLDSLQFARDLAATPLLDEGGCGADLLVSSSLKAFSRYGGWSLLPETERDRWLDALALVDESLTTYYDAIRVETVLTVRGMKSHLEASAPTPLGSILLKAQTHAAHTMLLDFEEEYSAAFAAEPLRRPSHVVRKYTRRAKSEGRYVERPLQQFRDATAARLWGLALLRLLRHALAVNAGREDVPVHGRLGLPIQTEVVDGVRSSYIETNCRHSFSRLEISVPVWRAEVGGD